MREPWQVPFPERRGKDGHALLSDRILVQREARELASERQVGRQLGHLRRAPPAARKVELAHPAKDLEDGLAVHGRHERLAVLAIGAVLLGAVLVALEESERLQRHWPIEARLQHALSAQVDHLRPVGSLRVGRLD